MTTRDSYRLGERVLWGRCAGVVVSRYGNPVSYSYGVKLASGQRIEARFADLRPDVDET